MPLTRSDSSFQRTVHVTVPATTANLGSGFDCLGLALNLRNDVTLLARGPLLPFELPEETCYVTAIEGVDASKIPLDRRNLLIQAAESVFKLAGRRPAELHLRMTNHIPVGSGLGSSSSAIVAGLLAGNLLLDAGFTEAQLLKMAVEMEGHPDNVAPALLGGLVLGILPDAQYGPEEIIVRRMAPPDLKAVIVLPDYDLPTSESRAALPEMISRRDAIFNVSRMGLLVHDLLTGQHDKIGVAMADRLHQPYRLAMIPGAELALRAAYEAGAVGVALSGAGPSLIAFTRKNEEKITGAMMAAFADASLATRSWNLAGSTEGAIGSVEHGR